MATLYRTKHVLALASLLFGFTIGIHATAQSFVPPAAATSSRTMPYSDLVQSQSLAIDSSGNIFFSRPASGVLAEKPANGGPEIALYTAPSGGGGYPKGVAANDTYAYLTDYAGHLWQVPISGGSATDILSACSSIDNGYLGSQEVAIDGLGNVFVAGNNFTTLFKITQANQCSIVNGVTLDANSHVSADAVGDLAYSTGGVLYSLPAGAGAAVPVQGSFNSIIGLRSDVAGDVFVTTYSGIVEVPFLNGKLDGTHAFTVLLGSSQNDVAVASNGVIYTTDGTNIFKNLLGSIRYAASPVATASPTQTLTVVFNSQEILTGIRYTSGTGTSTEIANLGTGSCTIGQSYVAGSSCTIDLTFTPNALGARNGALVLMSAAGVVGASAITGQGSGPGLVIDPGTQSNLGSQWRTPSSVAVGASGELLVTDKAAGTLTYFTPGSTTATVVASALTQPTEVAIAADGTAYVATATGTILQVPYSGSGYGAPSTVVTGLLSPGGLAVDAGGNLYVTNTGAGTILRYPNQAGALNFASPSVVSSSLKAPSGIVFDASGNLFVADSDAGSIVKIGGGSQTTVVTGLASPTTVAVDDAGSLYVLQTGVSTLLRIPYTNGSYNTNSTSALGVGFTALASFAPDSAGNFYIVDSGAPAVVDLNRTAGLLSLGRINLNASSTAQSLSLTNNGDIPLPLESPLFSISGDSGDFTIGTSTANACAGGGTLITSAACVISGSFNPTVTGPRTATLIVRSGAVNAASITGQFTGTGINLPTTTLTLGTNPTGSATYGTPVAATASIAVPSGSAVQATGAVTFLVNGITYKVVPLVNGVATVAISGLSAGNNGIDASYGGDEDYAASSGVTQTIAITLAPTVSTLTTSLTSAVAVSPGTSATLTATVLSSVATAKPTGTVDFVANGVTLASAAVNASTGVASVTTTTLPTGSYSVAAYYRGDPGFAPSSSNAVNVSIRTQQFDIGGSPTALNVAAPGSVTTSFNIVPVSGYIGGVNMACTGLPANTQCTFLPATIALSGSPTPQSVQLTITTYSAPPTTVAAVMAPFGALLLVGLWRRRHAHGTFRLVIMLTVMLSSGIALLALDGCGTSSNATPKGTSNIVVTLTGTPNGTTTIPVDGTGNIVKSFNFVLNVQ